MERDSSIERVVGDISPAEKENILIEASEVFDDQLFEELRETERTKTADELRIIALANEGTNEIRRRYGLSDFDIPTDNIHIVKADKWPAGVGDGVYNSMMQGVAVPERSSRLPFMNQTFHELVHFKSYNALQVTRAEAAELDVYRVGLTVRTRDGRQKLFANLNEAVTEELTRRYMLRVMEHPLFRRENQQTKDIMATRADAMMADGRPLFDDQTYYAELLDEDVDVNTQHPIRIKSMGFAYARERRILDTLIDRLLNQSAEKFQNREDIFDVFARGMISGNILPVGRLIDRTFGAGTLRRIGELDGSVDDQEAFVRSLGEKAVA